MLSRILGSRKQKQTMFTPSQFVKQHSDDTKHRAMVADIIEYVDSNLARGMLKIASTRSGWTHDAINEVADRYRMIGWKVDIFTGGGHTYIFHAPTESNDPHINDQQ